MDLADALAYPNCRRNVLVELELPVPVVLWTQHGTYTAVWYADVAGEVVGAREDGAALAEAASLVACSSADGSWYWDAAAAVLYVNPTASDPRDAAVQAIVAYGFAAHPRGGGDFPRPYFARLLRAPELTVGVDPEWSSVPQVSGGRLDLAAGDGGADVVLQSDLGAGLCRLLLGGDTLY